MKVLIIGANSAIAKSVARQLAEQKATLFLVGRDGDSLSTLSQDLLIRGAPAVENFAYDFTDNHLHALMLEKAQAYLGTVDLVLIAHGVLPDQEACQRDNQLVLQTLSVNAMSVIALSTLIANWLEEQGSGVLAVISSVAGDRGRIKNYVYGSSKAAVNTFLEGLSHRLIKKGVRVLTIKPGLVDTPMTANARKGLLWAQPDRIARDIITAVKKKRRQCYTPWFWRWIMLVVRNIPDPIFARIKV